MKLDVKARSNDKEGGGIAKVELYLDDLPLAGECRSAMSYAWNTKGITEGKHYLDVVATNAKGQKSRRRFEVYAGDVYLTEMGAAFDNQRQATEISVRNIAPSAKSAGKITLDIYTARGSDNKRGKKIFTKTTNGIPGAVAFLWNGLDAEGVAQPKGRYFADLSFKNEKGKVVQKNSLLFAHESEAAQRRKYTEIEGRLSFDQGENAAGNSVVDLVDDKGRVVQSVRSTAQGNYRFKSVSQGNYRVRARKKGWSSKEARVQARRGAPAASADIDF